MARVAVMPGIPHTVRLHTLQVRGSYKEALIIMIVAHFVPASMSTDKVLAQAIIIVGRSRAAFPVRLPVAVPLLVKMDATDLAPLARLVMVTATPVKVNPTIYRVNKLGLKLASAHLDVPMRRLQTRLNRIFKQTSSQSPVHTAFESKAA